MTTENNVAFSAKNSCAWPISHTAIKLKIGNTLVNGGGDFQSRNRNSSYEDESVGFTRDG
jgi:hypothetical protein